MPRKLFVIGKLMLGSLAKWLPLEAGLQDINNISLGPYYKKEIGIKIPFN